MENFWVGMLHRLTQLLESLVWTSERLSLNVLNLIIYIKNRREAKGSMDEYVGKFNLRSFNA